jgi:3-dehydroquinate synthase
MGVNVVEAGSYQVKTGAVFPELEQWIAKRNPSRVFLFMDENTKKYCLPLLQENIPGVVKNAVPVTVMPGEQNKTPETCMYLWEQLTIRHADRNALVINLSGGVLSDMGGFVAATYKRGICFINIPTTLLSMVDASAGGKVGIDFRGYKNQVGLFVDPGAVFIYPPFLNTLPEREVKSGLAEMMKHGLIAEEEYFSEVANLLKNDKLSAAFQPLIQRSVAIKQAIVSKDAKEEGLRKVLNFGHTAGHAIETWSFARQEPLLHGEAIALGMIIELLLSTRHAALPAKKGEDAIRIIMSCFSGTVSEEQDLRQIMSLMKQDKKNTGGKVLFALLDDIGWPVYDVPVDEKDVYDAFKQYARFL